MKKLGRHIEALLQDNDCVIVPNLGGFIARPVPAHYIEDEQLFFPPSRTVLFNERLSANDGLLAGRYMHEYQVSYSDATHMVDLAVDNLRDTLAIEGSATLPGVGYLHQDIQSAITFEPDETGIVSPAHFGLNALSIRPLDALTETPTLHRPLVQTDEHSIIIRIGRRALRTVAAAAAIALLLIVFALPTAKEQSTEMAGLPGLPTPAFREIQGLDIDTPVGCPSLCLGNVTESLPAEEPSYDLPCIDILPDQPETGVPAAEESIMTATQTAEAVVPAEKPATEPMTVVPATPTKRYHLIVGSLPIRKGTDDLVDKYVGLGFSETTVLENDGRFRISIASYTDKDKANAEMARLRESKICKSIWMLPVRN